MEQVVVEGVVRVGVEPVVSAKAVPVVWAVVAPVNQEVGFVDLPLVEELELWHWRGHRGDLGSGVGDFR